MPVTLGTNIPSLIARNNLNLTTDKLSDTYNRFSTGLKINKAGDDAAGLVVSQGMEATIRGSEQAQKNIQTASSFLKVAEEGMISIADHFQRINDLLVGMANGTNDLESNKAAVEEIVERLKEIDRLADSTDFNGKPILDGSVDSIIVQLGCDSTELSTLDISPALTDCHVKAFDVELPDNLNPELADFAPTNENCRAYMAKIQDAVSKLASNRGFIGAYENRMDSAHEALVSRIEALKEAKSIYTDIDVAQEATDLTTRQIMQQVNVSILSSANTAPQMALALLS